MSLSARVIILEYICPGLGVLIGTVMFAAPLRTCYEQVASGKGLQNLNPTPWAFMLGNCTGWITYGVLRHNFFVLAANALGFCMSIWLCLQSSKMQYVDQLQKKLDNQSDEMIHETNILRQPTRTDILVLGNAVVWLIVISIVGFTASLSNSTRELIVGVTVNINLVIFYAAPLSTIYKVLVTRNAATIHISTMFSNTFCGLFWGVYGLAILDFYIAVPNILGAALGAVQMVLCVLFPRSSVNNNNNNNNSRNNSSIGSNTCGNSSHPDNGAELEAPTNVETPFNLTNKESSASTYQFDYNTATNECR